MNSKFKIRVIHEIFGGQMFQNAVLDHLPGAEKPTPAHEGKAGISD